MERLGKYNRFAHPGFHLIIPVIERMFRVDIREMMVEAKPQMIITNDNLNAQVDAQVYLKVKSDEENVKASQYNVTNYKYQIVNLARTTLRNIIGTLTLKSANSERGKINAELRQTLLEETSSWGIEILRTELKEIDPPTDVQETMNKVVKAENEKMAAVDFATAVETQADGQRRAEIKKAEGIKQARILAGRGRGSGHPAGQRGGRQVLRRQRAAAAEAGGHREVAHAATPRSSCRAIPSSSTSSAIWPASSRCRRPRPAPAHDHAGQEVADRATAPNTGARPCGRAPDLFLA